MFEQLQPAGANSRTDDSHRDISEQLASRSPWSGVYLAAALVIQRHRRRRCLYEAAVSKAAVTAIGLSKECSIVAQQFRGLAQKVARVRLLVENFALRSNAEQQEGGSIAA